MWSVGRTNQHNKWARGEARLISSERKRVLCLNIITRKQNSQTGASMTTATKKRGGGIILKKIQKKLQTDHRSDLCL